MITIGFWNIDNKGDNAGLDKSNYISDFAIERSIDILILAEAGNETIREFLKKTVDYNQLSNGNTKLTFLSRIPENHFDNKCDLHKTRWLFYNINIPGMIPFNLASVHFHSKINWSKENLSLECVNFSRDIAIVEENTNCNNSILIGDFNMNPFEDGIVAANGLNAIQDLEYVSQRNQGREIDGTNYSYFYNPMWNFFGDHEKPYGTHYCRTPGHISQEWNIYDQVMFRKPIKDYLEKDYIRIVDSVGREKLTKAFERPDRKNYSDHLPIVFTLKSKII